MSPTLPERSLQVLLHHGAVQALAAVAAELGVEAHLVGGVLRDRLLGLPSRDLDAVVGGRGEAAAEWLARRLGARLVRLGGKAFGAYRLVGPPTARTPWVLDLWDREDASLEADLARRDFTVDSIALSLPAEGAPAAPRLIDPHGGLADLRRRVLRATTPESFRGDPLRVLRLPRLLVQLPGFTAEAATLELARRSAPDVVAIAAERVRDELTILFSQPEVDRGVAVLGALDLYPGLWLGRPGEATAGTRALGGLCARLARLGPAATRLREIAGSGAPEAPRRPLGHPVDHRIARLALTFAHLPAEGGLGPAEALARFAEVGYLTRRDVGSIARLLPVESLPEDETGRRRYLHRLGDLAATATCYAGALAGEGAPRREWEERAAALGRLYRREGEAIVSPPRLLDGREVAALLGVDEGPEVGAALRDLRWAQVEGRVRTRAEAEELIGRCRRSASRPPSAAG